MRLRANRGHDVRTLFVEIVRRGETDASRRTGDDDGLALQQRSHGVLLLDSCFGIRSWSQLWIVDINQFSVTWIGLGVKRSRLRRPTPLPGITPQRSGIRYAIPPSVPRDPSCPHGRSI